MPIRIVVELLLELMSVGGGSIILWVRFRSATGYTTNDSIVGTSRGLSSSLHDLIAVCIGGAFGEVMLLIANQKRRFLRFSRFFFLPSLCFFYIVCFSENNFYRQTRLLSNPR